MSDNSIVHLFDEYYQEAYSAWNSFYPLAERDLRAYLGDQWDEKEKRDLFQEGRSAFVFNRIRRNINMVTGYQRKHRLSSVVSPVENSDQKTADQLSKLLLYAMNRGDGYQIISDCFGGALKTGWNLMSLWMDYREDPINGDICFQREPYSAFITDPYFTSVNFSDCAYIQRRKYIGIEQAESLLPGQEKELRELHKMGWARDDKFTWLPYQRQPNGQDLLAYNEFYLQKWRNVPMIVDMESGEYTEFDVDDDRMKEFLQIYPQLKVLKRPKRYIERHIIVNDELMRSDENPYGLDEYPFVPFLAVFEPESDQWDLKVQSLIRCMIDPQRESNRRRSQMIDILDSQINSGWIADENSVVNPRSLFQSSQGKVVWRKQDAKPGALEKIPPAQIPPSMFQLQEIFDKDIVEIAGINDAAFGMTENAGESGIMMMLRQGASIVNLQDMFDNLRASQKSISRKVLKLIQTWSPEKVQRIINENPSQQFYNKDFSKYDVVVQEGILTDTQQQMYFRQLVDLKNLGAPVTGEMLAKAAPIQGKSEFIEQLSQLEQSQQQAAQQQAQLQNEVVESERQSKQAQAISDIALSKERFTRAVANMGLEDERASKAVQDRADSALSRVKAMKELQMMNTDQLVKYLGIIRLMEQSNKTQEENVKRDDVQISAEGEQASLANRQLNTPLGEISPEELINQPEEEANARL